MDLKERFAKLWSRAVGAVDGSKAWQTLDSAYGDPARAYHNWSHVKAMLGGLDDVRHVAEFGAVSWDEVEQAIFFHDAIYEAAREDNEARSAEFFKTSAGERPAMGQDAVERVAAMILATAQHLPTADISTRLLLDLDLAVLGGSPEHYALYARAVRAEYAAVPDDAWRIGRAAVMRRFLDRERIYQTSHFRARLETPARANIAAEIGRLEGRG